MGANSTDPVLQDLPALQNQNTRALLSGLDEAGAKGAPSASDASVAAIGSLKARLASEEASRDALYAAARDSQGRSVVLDGPAAAQAAVRKLKADNVGKLPAEVDQILNDLTAGNTPLTVEYQQQLVKNLYRKMRGAGDNGDLRHGLQVVRDALDNAELPANAQGVDQAGKAAVDAFRAARSAHRALRERVDSNPALRAVEDGVEPDRFVQRYIVGAEASAADVRALREELNPEAASQMRKHLVKYLKDKATGGDEDLVKFSGKTYRDALRAMRDKLPAFFSESEIQTLEDIGNAAKYMKAQPDGSAVNNSASGALLLGRRLDALGRVSRYVPFGVKNVIEGGVQAAQQRQAMAPANALRQLGPTKTRPNPLLLLPLVAAGQGPEDR